MPSLTRESTDILQGVNLLLKKKTIHFFVLTVCHCSKVNISPSRDQILNGFDSKRTDMTVGRRLT